MRAEEYLTILTDQIRCKMARKAVREEIRCHIEDQTAAFLSEGMEQAEAEEAAVRTPAAAQAVAATPIFRMSRRAMLFAMLYLP